MEGFAARSFPIVFATSAWVGLATPTVRPWVNRRFGRRLLAGSVRALAHIDLVKRLALEAGMGVVLSASGNDLGFIAKFRWSFVPNVFTAVFRVIANFDFLECSV